MILRILQGFFVLALGIFSKVFFTDLKKNGSGLSSMTKAEKTKVSSIGFMTNFGDALGIGNFGPNIALLKLFKIEVKDQNLPGTLNVAGTLPVLLEGFLFTSVVSIDHITLLSLIGAAVVGSYIGAGIISKLDENIIQVVMGIALFAAAIIMTITHPYLGLFATKNTALGLTGNKLIIGIVGNFIFGALMTAGVGLYAPCMAMVFLLGMNVKAAFPIMMGSCALLMPTASVKFIKEEKYNRGVSLIISIFGLIGVAVAYLGVKNVQLEKLQLIIIAVIAATSITMFKKGIKNSLEKKRRIRKKQEIACK